MGQRKRSLFAWAALVVSVVMACGGQSAVTQAPASSVQPGTSTAPGDSLEPVLGTPSPIFDPVEPVDLTVVLENDNTVEKVVPVEGGSVSVTGADGTTYTLDLPDDALLAATSIGLTPVASITGLPFGTGSHAVQLSPDGLSLLNFATLTIAPAADIPVAEQILFGYSGEGKDVIFAPPVFESSEIKVKVLHFSGNGVTRGLLSDIEPARARLGGDAERRLQSATAERLGIERQRLDQGLPENEAWRDDLLEAMRQYEAQVVRPRIAAAGDSCAAGQLAIQTVLGYERQLSLLGVPVPPLSEQLPLLDKVGRVCVIEEFELCVEQHIIHRMVPILFGMQRQNSLLGGGMEGVIREAEDLTIKCLSFTLDYESTGNGRIDGGTKYESSVTSKVIMRYDPSEDRISGTADLVNTDYEMNVPGCNATETTGGGTFSVFKLLYVDLPGASTTYNSGPPAFGYIKDMVMNYHPGNSSERASIKCKTSQVIDMALPAWSTTFLVNHSADLDATGWTQLDWKIKGGALFAEKEWSFEKGGISEQGSFHLHHTPGA